MDLSITSLRGGMNNTDAPIALPDDQAVLAQNVEFIESMLGERRLGSTSITLPSAISSSDRVTFLHRHLPTEDEAAAELWVLGVTGTVSATLQRKTTTWAAVSIADTPTLTDFSQYRWAAVSLHGKLFVAYDSAIDRLHVWDGTSLRRTGLAEPVAPTAADDGSGAFAGRRYYRVRYTEQVASVTTRRSESSDPVTIVPSGSGSGILITRPALLSEGETHWELEASFDNVNYYLLTTNTAVTTTYTDTTAYSTGYAGIYPLSEDIGDYALIPSAKFLIADEDRLVWASSWEDASLAARVGWTPVFGADGVGNDERFETDTDPYLDLDTYEGGPISGMSTPTLGAIWVFKSRGIYKLVRTGKRNAAYTAIKFSNQLGALHGSVISGVDATGQPCVYFIDPNVGPCRIGYGGVKRCGEDLRRTWETMNINATQVICNALFYPKKQQVFWNIAIDSNNTPTKRIVLHTSNTRDYDDGVRKGWVLWDGNISKALCMCLFSTNIDDNVARNRTLVPFIGLAGLGFVHRCDTTNTDNSVAYTATITTKPYWLKSLLRLFIIHAAVICAKAVAGAQITISCIRDFGLETTSTTTDNNLAPTASETDVIVHLDNLVGNELNVAQFTFTDPTAVAARWQLNRFDVSESAGQD